jgi:pSer/pThr/pTyr-binding forkhead associated (FHA) protein
MARIVVKIKEKTVFEMLLSKPETVIGRDPASDIHLENPAVSRRHAKLYQQLWPYYVEDLKSTNGTYLNGKRISWKSPLKNGDVITIGKHSLVFLEDPTDHGEQPAADPNATVFVKRK